MPRINLEDELFEDDRYKALEDEIGKFMALGVMGHAFKMAQNFWVQGKLIPLDLWKMRKFPRQIFEVGLAEIRPEGVYIRGSEERFLWLMNSVKNGALGGRPKSKSKPNKITSPAKPTGSVLVPKSEPSSLSSLFSKDSCALSEKNSTTEGPPPASGDGPVAPELEPVRAVMIERKVPLKTQRLWLEAYPDAPWVVRQVRAASLWEMTNNKRKVRFDRFVSNWLARDWDRRPAPDPTVPGGAQVIPPKPNRSSVDAYEAELKQFVENAMKSREEPMQR